MATSDAPNTRRLARQLVDVTRRLKHLETVPQLSNSSLDNQGMHVYDADGNVSVTLGKQEDGTYSARPVAGPTPPAPVGLDAEGDAGLIHASWQGVFWAGAAMPRDFEAVEVLVDGNVQGAIHDPEGGSVAVPAFAGERVVSFRTLSQAGRHSGATGDIAVTVQSKASVQLDEARGRIDEAKADSAEALVRVGEAEATVEAVQGGLDTLETVTLPGAVAELEAADVAVQQAVAGLEGEVSAVQGVANAAQDAATQAASDAAAAAQDAADAAGLAASKGDVLIQSAAPATEMRKASTLWIDTTGGANTPKRWDGSTWIAVTDKATVDAANLAAQAKAAADDAQTAADDAQTTATNAATAAGAAQSTATEALTSANGKSKITRSTSNPPAQYGGRVDDLWWVLSSLGSGGRVLSQWRWNSNVWVSEQVGGEVIANLDAAKIGTGYLDAARIQAGSIYADKIVSGLSQNMVPDAGFGNAEINAQRLSRANDYGEATFEIEGGVLRITTAGGAASHPNISLSGNDDWYSWTAYPAMKIVASAEARAATGVGQVIMTLRYELRDGTRSSAVLVGGYQTVSPEWATYTWSYEFPQDIRSFSITLQVHRLNTDGVIEFRSPHVASPTGTTLIEDGAVTTDKILAGAVTAEKITVTEALSANIVDAMSVNAKKLVVTEEAILNHATLIGDTVVDNINVTGKLIGTDGVFTGTVDFENVNVTGLQLVEKLEANSISADLIEGGAFVGESFTGGTFIGGEFRTSDTLPGQVTLSDTGYTHSGTGVSRPGIRIDPEDSTGLAAAAGIGPIAGGFEIDGGRSTSGERTSITMRPGYSLIRADGSLAGTGIGDISVQPAVAEVVARKGAHQGSIQAGPGDVSLYATHPDGANAAQVAADTLSARLRAYRTDGSRAGAVEATATAATVSVRDAAGTTRGSMEVSEAGATSRSFSGNASESGWVRARPQDAELAYVDPGNVYASRIKADASEAFLYTSAGGTQRYLTVDADGVWVKTNESGSWKQYNLEETAQDSGWEMATVASGYTAQPGYPPKARKVGNLIYLSGGISGAGISANTSQYVLTLPPGYRPVGNSVYVVGGSSSGAACPLFVILPDGRVSLRTTSTTGSYYLMDGISFIPE